MAAKKKSVRRKKGSRTRKKQSGAFKRFINAVSVSAIMSFMAASCALNPQLRDSASLEPLLAQLERFTHSHHTAPAAAPVNGYVQTSFAKCPQFFPNKQRPIVPASHALRELCFSPFAVLHSGQSKTPVFVAQRLNRPMLTAARKVQRKDRFYEEARLPSAERAKLADYGGSGFDRGHMAPAGDMHNDEAMAQSFSLANMVPQNAQHNRGAWSKIEADTRKYVMRAQGDVYVFTGPVYMNRSKAIGEGQVGVPTHLYKRLYPVFGGRVFIKYG